MDLTPNEKKAAIFAFVEKHGHFPRRYHAADAHESMLFRALSNYCDMSGSAFDATFRKMVEDIGYGKKPRYYGPSHFKEYHG